MLRALGRGFIVSWPAGVVGGLAILDHYVDGPLLSHFNLTLQNTTESTVTSLAGTAIALCVLALTIYSTARLSARADSIPEFRDFVSSDEQVVSLLSRLRAVAVILIATILAAHFLSDTALLFSNALLCTGLGITTIWKLAERLSVLLDPDELIWSLSQRIIRAAETAIEDSNRAAECALKARAALNGLIRLYKQSTLPPDTLARYALHLWRAYGRAAVAIPEDSSWYDSDRFYDRFATYTRHRTTLSPNQPDPKWTAHGIACLINEVMSRSFDRSQCDAIAKSVYHTLTTLAFDRHAEPAAELARIIIDAIPASVSEEHPSISFIAAIRDLIGAYNKAMGEIGDATVEGTGATLLQTARTKSRFSGAGSSVGNARLSALKAKLHREWLAEGKVLTILQAVNIEVYSAFAQTFAAERLIIYELLMFIVERLDSIRESNPQEALQAALWLWACNKELAYLDSNTFRWTRQGPDARLLSVQLRIARLASNAMGACLPASANLVSDLMPLIATAIVANEPSLVQDLLQRIIGSSVQIKQIDDFIRVARLALEVSGLALRVYESRKMNGLSLRKAWDAGLQGNEELFRTRYIAEMYSILRLENPFPRSEWRVELEMALRECLEEDRKHHGIYDRLDESEYTNDKSLFCAYYLMPLGYPGDIAAESFFEGRRGA